MMGRVMAMLRKLGDFRAAQAGVAAVEFALILPIMLAVYLGAIEASLLITTDRKVQSVAASVGDLVARSDKTLSATQMRDYFQASKGIMMPYPSEDILQVITAVNVDDEGVARVAWSRQFKGTDYSDITPHDENSVFPLPDEMIAISKGQMVIAAETSYAYPPKFGLFFTQPINLYRSSFYLPRFGGTISAPS